MEMYKDIIGFENRYQVSNSGKIRSIERKCKIHQTFERTVPANTLKGFINKYGYYSVILCRDGERYTLTVHRLVAKHFLSDFSDNKDVNHKDGDKLNNNDWNLECISELENVCHYQNSRLKKNKFTNVGKMWNKFRARITINGKRKHLGLFDTEEEAKQAYQKALLNNNITNKYAK